MTDRKRDLSKWVGLLAGIIAVAVSFGGATVALGEVQSDVDELKRTIDKHRVEPAHHDSAARLTLAEERITVLDEERRDLCQNVADIKATQVKILRRLDALCVASPRCRLKEQP